MTSPRKLDHFNSTIKAIYFNEEVLLLELTAYVLNCASYLCEMTSVLNLNERDDRTARSHSKQLTSLVESTYISRGLNNVPIK